MDQPKKFNRAPDPLRIKPLLCCVLGFSLMSPALFAESALAEPPQLKPDLATPTLMEKPGNDRLARLKERLAKQYPDVRHLSIDDYLAQYPQAVLVDVRTAEEYAVSRIPGAVHIEDRAELLAFAVEHSKSQMVLYCSVGARSAEATRFLQQQEQSIGPVANLAGSIFEWANEKRPLENDAGPTTQVHSFNAWWGWRYLD